MLRLLKSDNKHPDKLDNLNGIAYIRKRRYTYFNLFIR